MKLTKSWLDKTTKPFNSSMLEIGEMMEITEEGDYIGEVIIKMYNSEIYSLNNLRQIYTTHAYKGRKPIHGESVTLTQE